MVHNSQLFNNYQLFSPIYKKGNIQLGSKKNHHILYRFKYDYTFSLAVMFLYFLVKSELFIYSVVAYRF